MENKKKRRDIVQMLKDYQDRHGLSLYLTVHDDWSGSVNYFGLDTEHFEFESRSELIRKLNK